MFNDIIGNSKKEISKPSKDNLIKSMKDNIKEKEELISKLVKRITELEGMLDGK